jgi:hypothetical protein
MPPQDSRSMITQALMQQANPPPVPPGAAQLPMGGVPTMPSQPQQPLPPSPSLTPQPAGLGASVPGAALGPMGPIPGPAAPGLNLPGFPPQAQGMPGGRGY